MSPSASLPASANRGSRNPFLWLWRARPWMAVIFLATSFVVGTALFTVLVTLLAVGGSLAFTLVGIPILALALGTWVGAAIAERWRIRVLLGERIENPYRPIPKGNLWLRSKAILRDPAVWKDFVYSMLLFPVGIAEFVATTVLLSVPFFLLAVPVLHRYTDLTVTKTDTQQWRLDTLPEALGAAAAGAVLFLPALALLVVISRGHAVAARWLLGRSRQEELEERVDVLTRTRSDVMEAMLLERRRIERDLHDGAQQRLVALAMNLGMAREKLDSEPEAARALIESSHEDSKLVLKELRELVQGIHPAVLTDRGLDAAVSAIAGRSPIPVTVDIALPRRLPEAVESTAYFIVAEALTNVAKHSAATEARVTILHADGRLHLIVRDNGRGGAIAAGRAGLAGLGDRVAALDGTLTVESPAGGGTIVKAEIPCVL